MKKIKIIYNNFIIGFLSQIILMLLQFVQRIILIKYIGITIVGISTALSSILSTLALTELGFQTAIVYHLYAPIQKKDIEKINSIMTVYKTVYSIMGMIFFVLSLFFLPFIKYILKDTEITLEVVFYYLMLSINSSATYFCAHRRSLLFADQKEYIVKSIDSLFNIIFIVIKLVIIVYFKNYYLFLVLQILQTIVSNIVIYFWVSAKYPYLTKTTFDFKLFKKILGNVKNVFAGRLAGYVYGATDNLIISSFLGVVYVGLYANYSMFTMSIKNVVSQVFNAMTSIIGNMLEERNNNQTLERNFLLYCHVRCIIASAIVVPWMLLANELVFVLFGEAYILDNFTVCLLGIDLYIHIVYSSCCEYINASGKFKQDKNIAIMGMFVNLIVSLVLVCPLGIHGILLGTVISQIFFWAGRSIIVYRYILCNGIKNYLIYIVKNTTWLVQNIIALALLVLFKNDTNHTVFGLFTGIISCELINLIVYICIQSWTSEGKMLYKIITRLFKKELF